MAVERGIGWLVCVARNLDLRGDRVSSRWPQTLPSCSVDWIGPLDLVQSRSPALRRLGLSRVELPRTSCGGPSVSSPAAPPKKEPDAIRLPRARVEMVVGLSQASTNQLAAITGPNVGGGSNTAKKSVCDRMEACGLKKMRWSISCERYFF